MTGSRRHFLKAAGAVIASSILGPLGLVASGCSSTTSESPQGSSPGGGNAPPNILLILTDQFRLPPDGYSQNQGEAAGIREIFRFENSLPANNPFEKFFPGILRLRKNGVVLRRHYIASAACAPSRSSFITGQYPSLHGVTQTDGLFKSASETHFLDPQGVPTLGDWFKAAGYSSYYFGKWHCSHVEPPYDLTPWGFSGWETSGPEPHGSDPNNLGAHRDPQFSSIINNFLKTQGTMPGDKPWFAVASFVNPHDISAYPFPFYGPNGVTPLQTLPGVPQPVPPKDTMSNPDSYGQVVNLNPGGFPQTGFNLPPTFKEDLTSKPACHLDAAYKVQLALRALWPNIAQPFIPFPLQTQVDAWSLAFGQFYVYLQYLWDLELQKILDTFDRGGLGRNTIIVFTSDHGEYALAHGQMVQKWHTAYNEAVRVPFVVSSPLVNASADVLKEVAAPTSHIDLAPTLLGLAGFHEAQVKQIQKLITGHTQVRDLVGTDLSPLIRGEGAAPPARPGVLFAGEDDITGLPAGVANPSKQAQYDDFVNDVNTQIRRGSPLVAGKVVQPNCVHMLGTSDFKLSRYYDPNQGAADQWEFYSLTSDPTESFNLVDFRTGLLRPTAAVPGLTTAQLQARLDQMKADLVSQEQKLLLTPV